MQGCKAQVENGASLNKGMEPRHERLQYIKRKRQMYELTKEEQDVNQFKHGPKNAWKQMKGRKRDIMGDFSSKDMYDCVKNLYAPIEAQAINNATI